MTAQWILVIVTYGPVAVGMTVLWRRVSRRAARERWPFDELSVRPAGESTRLEAAAWSEKVMGWCMISVGLPTAMFLTMGSRSKPGWIGYGVVFALTTAAAVFTLKRMWRATEKWRSYNLGFEGERFVGAELDLLAGRGFEVCHDVPFGKYNIDHVVVGPTGVFAVETKTRRKPTADGKVKAWTVIVHADALEFPWGRDRFGLEQAERNAKSLREWIAKSTGEAVDVRPVLALPGWMVDRRARNSVMVISAKNAAGLFAKGPSVLSDEAIRRIAFQLREKSRIQLWPPSGESERT